MVDPETGEHGRTTPSWRRRRRARRSQTAGLEPEDVDLLVVSTASPDYLAAASATFVQETLGLRALRDARDPLRLRRRRRGARRGPPPPRARPVRHRGRDRHRGDLAAARARLPRAGPRTTSACATAEPVQLRRRRRRDRAAADERRRTAASSAPRSPASAATEEARDADLRRRDARADPQAAPGQTADRPEGRRRRVGQVHARRAHRGHSGDAERSARRPTQIDLCVIPEGNAAT